MPHRQLWMVLFLALVITIGAIGSIFASSYFALILSVCMLAVIIIGVFDYARRRWWSSTPKSYWEKTSEESGGAAISGSISHEEILGVIWSRNIQYKWGLRGYALVITSTRIVGARKGAWLHSFSAYLGSNSSVSESDRIRAQKVASSLIQNKEFEIPKSSIIRMRWKQPSLFSHCHLFVDTTSGEVEVQLLPRTSARLFSTIVSGILMPTLLLFAGDRLYDEETGSLLQDEATASQT